MNKELSIGLIGFGCVGSGLYEVLNQSNFIDAQIRKIVVKDPTKSRSIDPSNFTYDVEDILNDPQINVVVELINDSEVAFEIVKKSLQAGKDVVTANKKLLAEHLTELILIANENNTSLLYEGAVAGSIPIIRNLEEYYNNDSLKSIEGIVNGTTNYILTQSNVGIDYHKALKEATELGFAELDPTLDVEGFDSKFKLVLLLKHAFGTTALPNQLLNVGITRLTKYEIAYANEKGYRIKLFARAEKLHGDVIGFVAPHLLTSDHFAYNVDNEFNAVVVEALFSNKQLFIGKGAGSHPTASAVLSDISALKFDYKYEYRKSLESPPSYTTDFLIKVYLGAKTPSLLKEIPFFRIEESFESQYYAYQVGWIHFNHLVQLELENCNELSLLILPERVKKEDEYIQESRSLNLLTIENN